jgi:hypothetical protein
MVHLETLHDLVIPKCPLGPLEARNNSLLQEIDSLLLESCKESEYDRSAFFLSPRKRDVVLKESPS